MQRSRALVRRTSVSTLGFAFGLMALAGGCESEVDKLPRTRSPRESLGQEIYKVLCRRIAGVEIPQDLDGRQTRELCLGDQEEGDAALAAQRAALPPRLVALAERRQAFADAFDELLPDDLGDGLEKLMREMVPFYEAPHEYMQEGTRSMAAVLRRLAKDDKALEGMARFSRDGMSSPDGEFGLLRASFGYKRIVELMSSALPPLTDPAGEVAPAFKAALAGAALELATEEPETAPDSDTCRTRELLQRIESPTSSEKSFASGSGLFSVARDVRGMPVPKRPGGETGADLASACGDGSVPAVPVPFPFADNNNDGFADVKGAEFVVDPRFEGRIPTPFPVPFERDVTRDPHGRAAAIGADAQPDARSQLYVTHDVDPTLLAALMRESARMFEGEPSAFTSLSAALPALLGDTHQTSRSYGKTKLSYEATDPAKSPLLDLVHAGGAMLLDPSYDESVELSLKLLREHEPELMKSMLPLLTLERNTRPGHDLYPNAKLEKPNTFWDELLFEAEKLSRRRNSKDGETLLEAALRSTLGYGRNFDKPGAPIERLVDARLLAHQGALMAAMMRFKDEWRPNPTTEGPAVVGFLKTPVDRDEPDHAVTCGRDGCGGKIVGTPFERWKGDDQNCVIQRKGRPKNSAECGEPSNQSLFHRSMSMLAELEGRAQCNRPITVRDLFQFAGETATATSVTEAETYLREDYSCEGKSACSAYENKFPAAFPDLDGTGPGRMAIQACGLIDVQDAGRVFGKVLTHEYALEIPNPWVRRYLEDIARAADKDLPVCLAHTIADPTKVPTLSDGRPCITRAATFSRSVYQELGTCQSSDPTCIDTLGELIEFLLEDDTLFATEADALALKPDPRALSRVMFAPESSTGSFVLFDPLLVRGAPPVCESPSSGLACDPDDTKTGDDARCCIKDPLEPPLRFKIDTYYGATTLAWEHSFKLADGSELSFLDAMRPLADAFNRLDIPPGADPKSYEDTRYGLTTLGTIVAEHYDSPDSGAQNEHPDQPRYRKLTGLVRYEALLADALDDGSIDLAQLGPSGERLFASGLSYEPDQHLDLLGTSVDLLEALDALQFHGGDGLSAIARSVEAWLNPHAYCAGATGDKRVVNGKGACDQGMRAPVAYRDGRDYVCWNDGTCFDGKGGRPKRFVSPLYLALDPASEMLRRSEDEDDPVLHEAARRALSGLLDAYAVIDNGLLKHRRLRAVALTLGEYARERYAEEKAAGTLDDYGARTTADAADMLDNPALAGGLLTLQKLIASSPEALPAISRFLHSLLDEEKHPLQARAMLAFASDSLQMLPGDAAAHALGRAYASSFARNVEDVLAGKASELDIENGATWNSAFVLGQQAKADHEDVLGRVLRNFARIPGDVPNRSRPQPLSALYDILIDVNRVDPLSDAPHTAADLRAAFTLIADVMVDEKRGFERMYKMLQCTMKQIECD